MILSPSEHRTLIFWGGIFFFFFWGIYIWYLSRMDGMKKKGRRYD